MRVPNKVITCQRICTEVSVTGTLVLSSHRSKSNASTTTSNPYEPCSTSTSAAQSFEILYWRLIQCYKSLGTRTMAQDYSNGNNLNLSKLYFNISFSWKSWREMQMIILGQRCHGEQTHGIINFSYRCPWIETKYGTVLLSTYVYDHSSN